MLVLGTVVGAEVVERRVQWLARNGRLKELRSLRKKRKKKNSADYAECLNPVTIDLADHVSALW